MKLMHAVKCANRVELTFGFGFYCFVVCVDHGQRAGPVYCHINGKSPYMIRVECRLMRHMKQSDHFTGSFPGNVQVSVISSDVDTFNLRHSVGQHLKIDHLPTVVHDLSSSSASQRRADANLSACIPQSGNEAARLSFERRC